MKPAVAMFSLALLALPACTSNGGSDTGADAGTTDATDGVGDITTDTADAGTKADVPPAELPPLYINELAAKGAAIGDWNVTGSDWAELYNGSSEAIDLKGWRIIDSKTKGFDVALSLPPGTKVDEPVSAMTENGAMAASPGGRVRATNSWVMPG